MPRLSWLRENFYLSHFMLWYLDGENKAQVAEAIALEFDRKLAKRFVTEADSWSHSDENAQNLYQHIKQSHTNLSDDPRIWHADRLLRRYRPSFIEKKISLERAAELAGQHPNIAQTIWWQKLSDVLYQKNSQDEVLLIIENIQQLPIESPYQWQMFDAVGYNLLLDKHSKQSKQALFAKLAETQTIYIDSKDNGDFSTSKLIEALQLAGFNTGHLNTVDISKSTPVVDAQLLNKVAKLKTQLPPSLQSEPERPFCNSQNQEVKVVLKRRWFSEVLANEPNSPWLKNSGCWGTEPDPDALNYYARLTAIKQEFNLTNANISELSFVEQLDFKALKQRLAAWPEAQRKRVYEEFRPRLSRFKTRYKVREKLIENGIFANDPSAFFLLQQLSPLQAEALFRRMQALKPFENGGAGLPLMAYITDQWDLALQLIDEGYLLAAPNESRLDPIGLLLQGLKQHHTKPRYWAMLDAAISQNGQVQPHQVNQVYRLKLEHPELFNKLISRHPELFPYQPEHLVEISCD